MRSKVFRDDLKTRNLWNDCVVVVISEFGRRVFENGSNGTDHGHGNAFLVMGGRVKGRFDRGRHHRRPGRSRTSIRRARCPSRHDFRDLYGNVIQRHLGVSPDAALPRHGVRGRAQRHRPRLASGTTCATASL